MLSVNRMNAQIKLTEVWKKLNQNQSPLNFNMTVSNPEARESRSVANNKLAENYGSYKAKKSFISDGKKLWNLAPTSITLCKSIDSAKKEIKSFVKTIPV